jgi:LmbE family N-acetylglucosaminyl deacetylase
VNRLLFLIGRRVDRTRGRIRAAQERGRLERVAPADAPAPVDPATAGGTLAVIPHQADDFLFFSTILARDAAEGRRVLTVHLTAGDDDEELWYWQAREAGVRAAYADLHGVADRWIESTVIVAGAPLTQATLVGAPQVVLLFVRLPDGRPGGEGGARSGFASLKKLWEGDITTISAVDGSASHSLASLLAILRALLADFRPDHIVTTDHVGAFSDGDHSDHHAAGYLTDLARADYEVEHTFTGYRGYATEHLPANLDPEQVALKRRLFFAYAPSDYKTPQSLRRAEQDLVGAWLTREYAL